MDRKDVIIYNLLTYIESILQVDKTEFVQEIKKEVGLTEEELQSIEWFNDYI